MGSARIHNQLGILFSIELRRYHKQVADLLKWHIHGVIHLACPLTFRQYFLAFYLDRARQELAQLEAYSNSTSVAPPSREGCIVQAVPADP